MTTLPQHIEAYLQEAGFTATEILVIKKLLERQAMTLREIASKTGKSTGVLDQATKKLIRKKILTREVINDSPKYVLSSIDAIAQWMKKDVKEKREVLKRKQENFESFIATLKTDQARPDIEHFDGPEGVQKAYKKLLLSSKELLHYAPITIKEEDDPLRSFFVDFFRERRRRGIFSRILSANTPLGRRFQSRDHFEYRQTILMPEEQLSSSFEKIIAGDIIACINRDEQKASLIRYPELAETERTAFEVMWAQEHDTNDEKVEVRSSKPDIPTSTRTLSAFREFFLSRKSVATLVFLGIVSGLITYGLYRHNIYLNTQRIRERVTAIAATAAPEFDSADIKLIHKPQDMQRAEYQNLVKKLNQIRDQNPGVVYAYILRPTKKIGYFEFVADADSLTPENLPPAEDEYVEPITDITMPGEEYFFTDDTEFIATSLSEPIADYEPVTDKWGTWISGFAPIFDNENAIAIVGMDISASEIHKLTSENYKPIYYFICFFALFVLIKLVASNILPLNLGR